jgi:hypothetical protein
MKNFYYLHNGRSALDLALINLNLKSNDEILYPEYSCDVIFQHNKKRIYNYQFYKTKSNFSISIDYLKERITSKTKVIVIINFFGIKQNLKTLYKFCKKNKILLFLDECHTYYNLYHSSDNDCDVKFFSPSKIFDRLNNYGILQVNNHRIKITKNIKIIKKKIILLSILKKRIKDSNFYDKYKFAKKRPKYEDQNFFKSKYDVKNFIYDEKSIIKIKLLDIKKENKLRIKNFKFWKLVCKKLKIKPIINLNVIKHGCPLYFPAICKSYKEAIKIYDLGWKNNVEIISWPTLHMNQKKNKRLIKNWGRHVYFPMEKNYFVRKDIL